MAVKTKAGRSPKDGTIKDAISSSVEELWDKHAGEIHRIRESSEDKSIVVTFSNEIDCSESEPLVTTRIRYSESFTDKITNRLDDPNQGTFKEIDEEAEKENERKRREKEEKKG